MKKAVPCHGSSISSLVLGSGHPHKGFVAGSTLQEFAMITSCNFWHRKRRNPLIYAVDEKHSLVWCVWDLVCSEGKIQLHYIIVTKTAQDL